jgi:hypothetical protein
VIIVKEITRKFTIFEAVIFLSDASVNLLVRKINKIKVWAATIS